MSVCDVKGCPCVPVEGEGLCAIHARHYARATKATRVTCQRCRARVRAGETYRRVAGEWDRFEHANPCKRKEKR